MKARVRSVHHSEYLSLRKIVSEGLSGYRFRVGTDGRYLIQFFYLFSVFAAVLPKQMTFRTWFSSLDLSTLHVFIHNSEGGADKFYSVYDSQARSLAELYFHGSGSDVVKKENLPDNAGSIDVLNLSRRLLGELTGKLLDGNTSIKLWKKANRSESLGLRWVSAYDHTASPGRFQCLEDELGSLFIAGKGNASRESLLAAIVLNSEGSLGLAIARSLYQQVCVYEIANSKARLEDIESVLIQSGAREVLIVAKGSNGHPGYNSMGTNSLLEALLLTIKRTSAAITFVRTDLEDQPAHVSAVCGEVAVKNVSNSFLLISDNNASLLAIAAASAILKYIDAAPGAFELTLGSLSEHLLYDTAVSRALGLLPSVKSASKNIFSGAYASQTADNSDEEFDSHAEILGPESKSDVENVFALLAMAHKTAMGRRMIRSWIQAPLCGMSGLQKIKERQRVINLLKDQHAVVRNRLREHLLNCPDIQAVAVRFVEKAVTRTDAAVGEKRKQPQSDIEDFTCRAKLTDLVIVYRAVLRLRSISNEIGELYPIDTSADNFVTRMRNCLQQFSRFQALVEEVVDEAAFIKNSNKSSDAHDDDHSKFLHSLRRASCQSQTIRVRASFTPDLALVEGKLKNIEIAMLGEAEMCDSLTRASEGTKKAPKGKSKATKTEKTVFIEYSNVHGVHFRVTKRNSERVLAAMRAACAISGGDEIRILSQQNAGILFVTPCLATLAAQYFSQLKVRTQLESNITRQALHVACTFQACIRRLSELLAEMDVLAALAHIAAMNEWSCPILDAGRQAVEIRGLRHCVVETQIGRSAYIPSDFVLSGESGNIKRLALLTGPNMGGKSTFIRALGIVAVLSQIGSFVPASVCKLPIFDRILCRVGACDSLSRGISTFKSEMLELQGILSLTTNRSLVIIDELGRGTSTHEGFGIASAAVEYLSQVSALTVFATHFHELTFLAEDKGPSLLNETKCAIANLHVDTLVKPSGVTMLYNVKPGPCLHSYGVHVAQHAQFPDVVVKDAEHLALRFEESAM